MKVYEKMGIDPTTKEGMKALLALDCRDVPEEFRNKCEDDGVTCGECISNYLMSEVKEIDWTKVPKDTPVIVWDYRPDGTQKRYFCGFDPKSKYPYLCFDLGCTSWSNNAYRSGVQWAHCELAFPEQAKEEWYK